MSNFFIDRPIFAWVLAILLCLCGTLSIISLPVEQYPDLAPPNVRITANYPGASAETTTTHSFALCSDPARGSSVTLRSPTSTAVVPVRARSTAAARPSSTTGSSCSPVTGRRASATTVPVAASTIWTS